MNNEERLKAALAKLDQMPTGGFKIVELRRIFELNVALGRYESPDNVFEPYANEAEAMVRNYAVMFTDVVVPSV